MLASMATLPTLDGISAELAEHSAELDHTLDQRPDGTWFCETCQVGAAVIVGTLAGVAKAKAMRRRR